MLLVLFLSVAGCVCVFVLCVCVFLLGSCLCQAGWVHLLYLASRETQRKRSKIGSHEACQRLGQRRHLHTQHLQLGAPWQGPEPPVKQPINRQFRTLRQNLVPGASMGNQTNHSPNCGKTTSPELMFSNWPFAFSCFSLSAVLRRKKTCHTRNSSPAEHGLKLVSSASSKALVQRSV